MKFKVGDKVRCIKKDMFNGKIIKVGEERTVAKLQIEGFRDEENAYWLNYCFELAEQPKPIEPQVGDVWGSEDKSRVVRVVGKFERNSINWVSFLRLNGESKGVATFNRNDSFTTKFPLLLHRPPKKQPKPRPEQPKKQEEVWEPVTAEGIDSRRCFRKGNSIKWVEHGEYEGVATCNKNDKFDLLYGVDLAWCRAQIKYFEAKIAEMIKEGVK